MRQRSLPTRLHDLLGHQPEWNDELWDQAMRYLSENISSMQTPVMEELIPGSFRTPSYFKADALAPFRDAPPTLLLAAYDWLRIRKRADARLAELGRMYPVEQRSMDYYSIPTSGDDGQAA